MKGFWMKRNKECSNYFKNQAGWKRCFLLMRKKWESLGKVGGQIHLEHCTEEEKKSVGRFLGRIIEGDCIEYSLVEFEDALKKTRYSDVSFLELMETYFGESLVSNQERREIEAEHICNFFEAASNAFKGNQAAQQWIEDAYECRDYGYTLILQQINKDTDGALELVKNIGNAVSYLHQQKENEYFHGMPIAVFAAKISGNPHYFDRNSISGRLLMYALCWDLYEEYPHSAMKWKERLSEAKVLSDNISSQVTVFGIHLYRKSGLHQGVEEFCQIREPLVLSTYNMKDVVRAAADDNEVFIVENEMVFDFLIESVHKEHKESVSIICTSGQLHSTAFDLIDLLAADHTIIHYSGDLDPEGMGIADRLWQRHPAQVSIWHMDVEDYKKSISHESINDKSITMLDSLQNDKLKITAEQIRISRLAGYQENLLQDLQKDVLKKKQHIY